MKRIVSVCSLIALFPVLGFAHEGHGHTNGFTITHYFVEPEHLATMIGILLTGFIFSRYYFKKKEERKN
jgi:hydrogenase/urease accessory protein HupE